MNVERMIDWTAPIFRLAEALDAIGAEPKELDEALGCKGVVDAIYAAIQGQDALSTSPEAVLLRQDKLERIICLLQLDDDRGNTYRTKLFGQLTNDSASRMLTPTQMSLLRDVSFTTHFARGLPAAAIGASEQQRAALAEIGRTLTEGLKNQFAARQTELARKLNNPKQLRELRTQLGEPIYRNLMQAGVERVAGLADWTEEDLTDLPNVSIERLAKLKAVLADERVSLKTS